MTNLFRYDFAPTRTPPIGLANLNLPGSFGDLSYAITSVIGSINWVDIVILGFAAYGAFVGLPIVLKSGKKWVKKNVLK